MFIGHGVFINNGAPSILYATFFDSGSIVVGVLKMIEPGSFYNPHAGGSLTSVYGWAPNALLWLQFAAFEHLLRLPAEEFFALYAATAKLNNFLFTLASLALFYRLAQRLFENSWWSLTLTIFLGCFSPLIELSSQVHPEPAGTFFVLLALHCLLGHLEDPTTDTRLLAAVCFSALAALSKPPFGLAFVCVGGTYLITRWQLSKQAARLDIPRECRLILGSLAIIVIVVLAIHPYMLIELERFRFAMGWIHAQHAAPGPGGLIENGTQWFVRIFVNDYVVLAGILSSVTYLLISRGFGSSRERLQSLLCVFNLAYVFWLCWYVTKPYSMRYLYPVYPTLLLISAGLFQRLRQHLLDTDRPSVAIAGRVVLAGLISIFVIDSAYHFLFAVTGLTDRLNYQYTRGGAAREFLQNAGPRPWRVVYHPSIPVPESLYRQTWISYGFPGTRDQVLARMNRAGVNAMVVDHNWHKHEQLEYFLAAADALGLQHETAVPSSCPGRVAYRFASPMDIPNSLDTIRTNLARASQCTEDGTGDSSISILTRLPADM